MNDAPVTLALNSSAAVDDLSSFAFLRGDLSPDLIRDELLCDIFAATAKMSPQAIALKNLDQSISYEELDRRSDALKRGLLTYGAGPGDVIGLWMARGIDLLCAQLAIAKTGAAWLPFDADAPVDRIADCLSDAEARLLLVSSAFLPKAASISATRVIVDSETSIDEATPLPSARELGATAEHPAYIIYTSGSTGRPKGTILTNRNICHYLRAANEIYRISASDVTFQGASLAFDLSMEEIWIAYLVGATLFVAGADLVGDPERLPQVLEAAGVTVFDTVPTLLNALPRDVATLKTIILGGEACPPSVAERWTRDGRVIFNSYGPTETTVVATIAEVRPGAPVSIGRPIPNYTCYVVNEALELVAPGVEGELLIGGPGVGKGYLKRDELTAAKFIANPFSFGGLDPALYRSGDAVALNDAGELDFRGRIDDQIKIRGFRVELGEIEAVLHRQDNVRQAAVVLRNDDGLDALIAFIVPDGPMPEAGVLRAALRKVLPSYMTPAHYQAIDALPTLPSGKVDRKSLQRVELSPRVAESIAVETPDDATQAQLLAAARTTLATSDIPLDADFFTELGGHSLLAARYVSLLRETKRFAAVTLQDLYACRTIRALAARIDETAGPDSSRDLTFEPPPAWKRFLCGAAQLAALPFLMAVSTAQWLSVFISYTLITPAHASFLEEALTLLGILICVNIGALIISVGGKWLVLGRTRPGRYPLWGFYFFRWWLAQRLLGLTNARLLQGSPLMALYFSALGARIGKDAQISDVEVGAIDLVAIGEGASLGSKLKLANARVEGNTLVIGEIHIGADAYVGTGCVIEENVVIGDGAALEDLTSLPSGARVGALEIWDGSPGKSRGKVDLAELDPPAQPTPRERALTLLVSTLLVTLMPVLGLLPIFPAFWAFDRIEASMELAESQYYLYLAAIPVFAWPTAFVLVLATIALIVTFRWLMLPRVTDGVLFRLVCGLYAKMGRIPCN